MTQRQLPWKSNSRRKRNTRSDAWDSLTELSFSEPVKSVTRAPRELETASNPADLRRISELTAQNQNLEDQLKHSYTARIESLDKLSRWMTEADRVAIEQHKNNMEWFRKQTAQLNTLRSVHWFIGFPAIVMCVVATLMHLYSISTVESDMLKKGWALPTKLHCEVLPELIREKIYTVR